MRHRLVAFVHAGQGSVGDGAGSHRGTGGLPRPRRASGWGRRPVTSRARPSPAEAAAAMRRRRATRAGVRLAVREWPSDGPGVALVHGLASSSRIFYPLARELWPDLHVVAYDQRGHGESDRPESGYGFEDVCADLGRVLRMAGLDRPVLVGHSWGANVVLEFGATRGREVAGLVLVDGGLASMSERMDWPTAREMLAPPRLEGLTADELIEGARARTPLGEFWNEDVERTIRSLFEQDGRGRLRPRLARANHMRILHALWSQPTTALLDLIRVPVLVLAARPARPTPSEADYLEMKQAAARRIRRIGPHVRFEWVTGVHDLPLQKPGPLARRISAFVAEVQAD